MLGVVQVDEEEDVTPRVVLDVDVLLEAVAMVLEVVAVAATDEARVAHVALGRPLQASRDKTKSCDQCHVSRSAVHCKRHKQVTF